MTATDLRDAVLGRRGAFLERLAHLVALESPSRDVAAVGRCGDAVAELLLGTGFEVATIAATGVADHVVGRMSGGPGPRTLVLAHMDTVWPVGTLREMPFEIDGDAARGPGTQDMKAGLVAAITAAEVAALVGLAGPLTLAVTTDEEIGSPDSAERILSWCLDHDRVLVVEAGRDDGALKVGRKGGGRIHATFRGRSAHAGNHPEAGASALRELAAFLPWVEALADERAGTTVNVTVASGGSVTNQIAEGAEAWADVRFLDPSERGRLEATATTYRPRDDRVAVDVEIALGMPPMARTPSNTALFERVVTLGAAMGIVVSGAVVGGGSVGNLTSDAGIATLDGIGCVGGGPHARHEHVRIQETLERAALMAALFADGPGIDRSDVRRAGGR